MRSEADTDEIIEGSSCKLLKDSSESESDDLFLRCEIRKSRRKNLMPQKAVQSKTQTEISHCEVGSSSGTSQEFLPDVETFPYPVFDDKNSSVKDIADSDDSSLSESEFLPNIYNDEEILKELQENPVNEEILQNLNEEDMFRDLEDNHEDKPETQTHTKINEVYQSYRAVKCNMCEQVFQYRADFDKHYLESYSLPPVYTCTFCNKTAEKYSTFRSHCYRHITEGRFKCSDCSKGFNLKSLLHIHFLAKHAKAKPFSCDQCGKKFVTKPGLRIHQKKHKTELKEDYPCVVCGKILHTRGGLTSHMNVHRLGRRFMCDVCGKTFTQKVNMQQHVKQHTGDKPHICDKCGKTFAERSHLARHYSFHSDQRPYKCDICQKMYKTERCLKVHSLVHASERPFVCSFCNKGFLSSTKLKQHSNIHTGDRPYKCKYCDRTFTNYPNLLKHTRRKHKPETGTDQNSDKVSSTQKEDPELNSAAPSISQISTICSEQPSTIPDTSLSKNEEILIEQSLMNVALTDEKFMSFDLLTGSSNGVGLIVPYFQNTLPSHQSLMQHINQATLSNQFTELLHNQYLQQSIPYE